MKIHLIALSCLVLLGCDQDSDSASKKTGIEGDSDRDGDRHSDSDADSDSDGDSDSDSDSDSDTDIGPNRDSDADSDADKGADTDSQINTGSGTDTGIDMDAASCTASDSSTYLTPVDPGAFGVSNTLWKWRLKSLITTWIPLANDKLSDINLQEGGIQNFVEAGKALQGKPAARHVGLWFANAYVLAQVETMAAALLLDAQGDQEIIDAQNEFRATLDDWIPKILSAQASDGYLQTAITLGYQDGTKPKRWTNRDFHEGYVAGYFLEAAIVYTIATGDSILYDAAKRLADCWVNNIGPSPKKAWWDGHQGMEIALVRFARFVDSREGEGSGKKYAELAKFKLDIRNSGKEYEQAHKPPLQQTIAVGHAVRATYMYSGMVDVAMTTGTPAYLAAADKLWDNVVNHKMYVNACIGSISRYEGFTREYDLPNDSHCESCSSCGMLFFNYRLGLAHKDGRYADLAEMALYNTIMGSIDITGNKFEYKNPLDQDFLRYSWHECPCCVGNIPRTLLQISRWAYAKSETGLYVNQFVGGTMNVGLVAGTEVEIVQTTDYPWKGEIVITVNPSAPKEFALNIRVPQRSVSTLYSSTPEADGITSVSVNGKAVESTPQKGYITLCRKWKAGDKVQLVLPMVPQRVKAIDNVSADVGRVALQYGPLIYNLDAVDYSGNLASLILDPNEKLTAEFASDLLGGVTVIKGTFKNGSPMTAIPHFARMNRGGKRSIVWIKDQ